MICFISSNAIWEHTEMLPVPVAATACMNGVAAGHFPHIDTGTVKIYLLKANPRSCPMNQALRTAGCTATGP